jgi:hypothetical protein
MPVHSADLFQRGFQLVAAITAQRADHVACETFGVQTHRHILRADDIAFDDGNVFLAVAVVRKRNDVKIAEARGQFRHRFNVDADLILAVAFTFVAAIFFQHFLVH